MLPDHSPLSLSLIHILEASNGDVYFYSKTYLTPRRAQALAEWDAVERIRNV